MHGKIPDLKIEGRGECQPVPDKQERLARLLRNLQTVNTQIVQLQERRATIEQSLRELSE